MHARLAARFLSLAITAALAPAAADDATTLPELTVYGDRPFTPLAASLLEPGPGERAAARDASTLLETVPGAALVRNGAQTGIVQLRGLFNERVAIRVDGLAITPACSNHMDPPLHYATAAGLETLEVLPGVTPVSQGGDSIAGTLLAKSAPPRFGTTDAFTGFGRLASGWHGANRGADSALTLGAANRDLSLRYSGQRLAGQNTRLPDGEVRDSGYDLARHDLTLAARAAGGTLRLDLGRHDSWNTGTPALPMDIVYDKADKIALGYDGDENAATALEARVYSHEIEHLMDNYSLRPLTTGMRMAAPTESDDRGLRLGARLRRGEQLYRAGLESFWNRSDGEQVNMTNGARQDIFNGARRERLGAYGEWQRDWNERWRTLAGLRADRVASDAGDIRRTFPANAAFAAAFNAADHDIRDLDWEWMTQARYAATPRLGLELALARKLRAPSLLERYLWSPSNASAGQADGRTYLGNLALEPEVSHQANLGAAWQDGRLRLNAGAFYNVVHDYIQGTPHPTLVDASGQPVLQYRNIGRAELYGLDGGGSYRVGKAWTLRAGLSYVRGSNRDNGDNLYRLAPLRADLGADYATGKWTHTGEWRLAARQAEVAAYNGETETPGYGIVHLRTRYRINRNATLSSGIENLFDREYADHLSGVNRVVGGDLPVGARLPGAGRAVYLAGEVNW